LELFDVGEADFATYDGVLQIGVPPRRIDILNRATGITFEEAIAKSDAFELDGRSIRVIGLDALLKNKTAAGREQDLADIQSEAADNTAGKAATVSVLLSAYTSRAGFHAPFDYVLLCRRYSS
jgi:hypothetical protein